MEGMSNEMKIGLNLKLGDATRVTPRNIQDVQASKLGYAKGIPFFINKNSIKIPGFFQSLHFYCFMHSCVVLGASSFSFSFWFFVLLGFLSLLNKLVGPPLSCIGVQIVWFGFVWKRVGKLLLKW